MFDRTLPDYIQELLFNVPLHQSKHVEVPLPIWAIGSRSRSSLTGICAVNLRVRYLRRARGLYEEEESSNYPISVTEKCFPMRENLLCIINCMQSLKTWMLRAIDGPQRRLQCSSICCIPKSSGNCSSDPNPRICQLSASVRVQR